MSLQLAINSNSNSLNSNLASAQPASCHDYRDLIDIFNASFFDDFNTRLVKGDDEPIYLPANESVNYHQIIFAHGFFASALHEVAHWCLAGPARRLKEDFGYWYLPDGRNAEQQAKFENVEIKPQAVEWALSLACNKTFDVSVDNLNGSGESDRFAFRARVFSQVNHYLEQGFPPQAQQLIHSLARFYGVTLPLTSAMFEQQQIAFMTEQSAFV
ncbi:MAG: elongation factor P hydroxylase [Thalassotalea sp.]